MKVNKLFISLSLVAVTLATGCSESSSKYETPYDLVADACKTGAYSISLRITESFSEPVLTENAEEGNVDLNYLKDNLTFYDEIQIYAYYNTDYLLIDYYQVLNEKEYYLDSVLYVNELIWGGLLSCVNEYYTYDGVNWIYYGRESELKWQSYYWSLFDNPTYVGLIPNSFYYVEDGKDEVGKYQDYAYSSEYVEYVFSFLIGVDLFDYEILELDSLYSSDYLRLYNDSMYSHYAADLWYYTDETYEYVDLCVTTFDTLFYDIGSTKAEERVNEIVDTAK